MKTLTAAVVAATSMIWTANQAEADWRRDGPIYVTETSMVFFSEVLEVDAIANADQMSGLPRFLDKEPARAPSSVGESGKCESHLGWSQHWAIYEDGPRHLNSSYRLLDDKVGVYDCTRID